MLQATNQTKQASNALLLQTNLAHEDQQNHSHAKRIICTMNITSTLSTQYNEFPNSRENLPSSTTNAQKTRACPCCARALGVPSLVAVTYAPAQPVAVYVICAKCAGALRQTSPAHQRRACEAIGTRAFGQEVAR